MRYSPIEEGDTNAEYETAKDEPRDYFPRDRQGDDDLRIIPLAARPGRTRDEPLRLRGLRRLGLRRTRRRPVPRVQRQPPVRAVHAPARRCETRRGRTETPPKEDVFRAAKCTQWAEGQNLDAIGDRPWLEWQRRPPNTSTWYGIEVENASSGSGDRYVYSESVTTAGVVRAVREAQRGERSAASIAVKETEFFDAVTALSDQRVSNRSEIGDAKPSIEGSVREWDGTSIDCWTEPPQHSGTTGHSVEAFVRYDGTVWRLKLSVTQRYSGPARAGNGSEVGS